METDQAALHVLKVAPPDIVMLDLGLPDLDGLSVLKQLRRKSGNDFIRTIRGVGYKVDE